jgi:transcriptional regulator with XRE-family HTH domain
MVVNYRARRCVMNRRVVFRENRVSSTDSAEAASAAREKADAMELAIGRELVALREAKKLSQEEAAKGAELDRGELARYESGHFVWRLLRHAPKLATVLGPRVTQLAYLYLAANARAEADELAFEARVTAALADILDKRASAKVTPALEAPSIAEVARKAGIQKPSDFVGEDRMRYLILDTRRAGHRRFPE